MVINFLDFFLDSMDFVCTKFSILNFCTKLNNTYDLNMIMLPISVDLNKNHFMVGEFNFVYNTLINFFFLDKVFMLVYSTCLYYIFFVVIFSGFTKFFFTPNSISSIRQFYFEYEHNVGNGEDLLMLISIIFSIIFLNFLYLYFPEINAYVFYLRIYLSIVFILIPAKIILMFGSNVFTYLNGTSNKTGFINTLYVDLINILVFFIRFVLQGLRLILIALFYFSIHEYVFTIPVDYLTNWVSYLEANNEHFLILFFKTLRWVFEFLDSTVSICNQLASFFFVIFWLFSYVNTFELKRESLFWFKKINISVDFNTNSIFSVKLN